MASKVAVYTTPPEILVDVLRWSHYLVSLPLVRRLRFAAGFPGGITEHSRILWCSRVPLEEHFHHHRGGGGQRRTSGGGGPGAQKSSQYERNTPPFAAAYLDFSRGPETELWIYSSMEARFLDGMPAAQRNSANEHEDDTNALREQEREEIGCAVALLREVKRQQDLYFVPGSPRVSEREFPTVLVGNLNEVLREKLVEAGMDIVSTGLYDKWVFEMDKLPAVALVDDGAGGPGDGRRWVWDVVRREDIPFTISRTKIPRREYVSYSPPLFYSPR